MDACRFSSDHGQMTLIVAPSTHVSVQKASAIKGEAEQVAPHVDRLRQGNSKSVSNARTGVGRGAGPKKRWDAEAEAVLHAEWHTDKPVDEIAAKIGRTVGSVRERARCLGLSRPKPTRRTPQASSQITECTSIGPRNQPTSVSHHATDTKPKPRTQKITRTRRPAHGGLRKVEPIDISAYPISRPQETLEDVINFVRSRDYEVVRECGGAMVVDNHKRFSEHAFIEWANGLRRYLKKPVFSIN